MKTFQVPVSVSYQKTIVLKAKDYDEAVENAEERINDSLDVDPDNAYVEAGDPIQIS